MNLAEAKEYAKKNIHNRPQTTGRLAGKIAVVTGGAQGFGLGIATEMYHEGASVVLADLNVDQAKEAAKVLYSRMPRAEYVDTIVCMDGTEVVGAFLSQEIENGGVLSTNRHETIYVVTPEFNNNNQMLFRDNNKGAIAGKHVVLLLATTTTGETIRRSLECIRYYGGMVEGVASLFSTVKTVDGVEVEALFDKEDITGYEAYSAQDCPFCKKGHKIEAMVNGFGYSKL